MSHLLLLRANGSAELFPATGSASSLWSSDSDDDFKDEVSAEFLTEDDLEDILEYLIEAELLSEEQADECIVEEESLEGDAGTQPLEGELADDADELEGDE